ncbi:uncharacterized protein PV09_05425 [Verruconis gallopava]|uniref:Uncharacterized protein n=1 Tax=Verruconis gallopava TaxID=253628 RepID=A0A0D2AVM3_9PEZI|nr:uncharacterized protein PV09_05425 [Verruconis gallopava]KIW03199.1 hypothetical protein PV09_05425 [Verruconis gallopava]
MRPLKSWPLPLALLISLSHAAPMKRQASSPAIPQDFPDPSIIHSNSNWYAYATTNNQYNVQLAKSPTFNGPWSVLAQDALPTLAPWAQGPVWGPDDDGQYIMYYSAALKEFTSHHCVGAALSSTPEGPFQPVGDVPLICPDPTGQGTNVNPTIASAGIGGAIDASGFTDIDGQRYIVYKVDGNSLGSGGSCGNSNPGATPTPIMLVAVDSDGITPQGSPIQLLDRTSADGPLIEAPNLVRNRDGTYALFFSSNCYSTPFYDVTWATADSVTGPYTRAGPLITTGVDGLTAPGGASIAIDGVHMAFHADYGNGRAMFINRIAGGGDAIRLTN